ncbi:16S rRNA (uracil(1498)-N(3))-methyltransferase [bacterium]|nr:16S rRNA (uracil(1498)-N(3))-methyltransferase [bacterium]
MRSHFESYYVHPKNVHGELLVLTDEEVHHLSRVKRHQKGDRIRAVDGLGTAYEAEVDRISKSRAECRITETRRLLGEPAGELTLVQAMIKGDRFDWVIEKCVEIGVKRIIPLITENTIVKAGSGKINRWRRVALGAMKQCGRSVLPEIAEPRTLKQTVTLGADCQVRLIAHGSEGSRTVRIPEEPAVRSPKAICIVGPEGGFTDDEIRMAADNGFTPVSLGPRRLRAETAGIVLTTMVLSQWGELC